MWSYKELKSRQGNSKVAVSARTAAGGLLAVGTAVVPAVGLALLPAGPAAAQSPPGRAEMLDVSPGAGFPSGAQAVVVEGLGIVGGCAYSLGKVERGTVRFINSGHRTVTEITPQPNCAGGATKTSAYKNVM